MKGWVRPLRRMRCIRAVGMMGCMHALGMRRRVALRVASDGRHALRISDRGMRRRSAAHAIAMMMGCVRGT
jgi:hypothetical protein